MKVTALIRYYHLFHTPDNIFEGHRHDSFEINIVLHGCLEVTYGDTMFQLSDGDFFMGAPNVFHRNRVLTSDATEFISLHFSADGLSTTLLSCHLSESDRMLVHVLDEEASEPHISVAVRDILEALVLRVMQKAKAPTPLHSAHSDVYRAAVAAMTDHIYKPLSTKELSMLCGVCTTTLKLAFSACTGKGINTYFTEMKIEAAKAMLRDGARVSEVSVALGFSSPSYFAQVFRRVCGMSAGAYKKQCGNL